MRAISHAHVDDHRALLALIAQAEPKLQKQVSVAAVWLDEIRVAKEEFSRLPWYKRWFSLSEPCTEQARTMLSFAKMNVKIVEKIKARAQYELTIELSESESNLVFQDHE